MKDRLGSKEFSEQDCNHLERIILIKKDQISDKQILLILSEALEIVRICGLLFSKLDSEGCGTVRIDSTDWRKLGDDTVYAKLKGYLDEMHLCRTISHLDEAHGGTFFFGLVNRIHYIYFIQEQLKVLIKDIRSTITQNESLLLMI